MNTNDTITPARVKVGDIFRHSWGYDQTNVDYFQAVRVTAQSVVLRPIGQEQVPGTGSGNGMSCKVRPLPGKFISGDVLTRRIKFTSGTFGAEAFVKMDTGSAVRVQPTETAYCSWYA